MGSYKNAESAVRLFTRVQECSNDNLKSLLEISLDCLEKQKKICLEVFCLVLVF